MNVSNGSDDSIAASSSVSCDDSPSEQASAANTAPSQNNNNNNIAVIVAADSSSDNTATSNEDGAIQDKTLSSSPPTTPPPSADPVDASPVDDQLATSSSPDRRSDLDEQPVLIAQDFLPSVLAVLDSLPPRRVKVYELRRDVWVDLGTGFCQGYIDNNIAYLRVMSEETPSTELLNCSIMERTEYVKQQDTLIVWTLKLTDMALSFQEGQGCAEIMNFINLVRDPKSTEEADDEFIDETMPHVVLPVTLPLPTMGSLPDIDVMVQQCVASNGAARESLVSHIHETKYLYKLVEVFQDCEDVENIEGLHHLSSIMKTLILINDVVIIEPIVRDDLIFGVAGILEYDAEFPRHRAHHRDYLRDPSKFRQVIEIKDPATLQKIHYTFRLQYLKDVVLARLMEEPVFSVLNSLIFFNQVDIVQSLCANNEFIKDLFAVFLTNDDERKRSAVVFIQQFSQVSKTLQAPARTLLYNKFAENGLYDVIEYALLHRDLKVRLAGADVVMIAIEHDPTVLRSTIARQLDDGKRPLLATLYESMHREADLGLKLQFFESIRILLDPSTLAPVDGVNDRASHMLAHIKYKAEDAVASDKFVSTFYRHWAAELCIPIIALNEEKKGEQLGNLSTADAAVYIHLLELMSGFVRLHGDRFRDFTEKFSLLEKASVLLWCKYKHIKLAALKFFRHCIGVIGDAYSSRMMKAHVFEPIIDILVESSSRNSLLNSAVLEFLQYLVKEGKKAVIIHIVEMYGERFKMIETFGVVEQIHRKYAQFHDVAAAPTTTTGEAIDRHQLPNGIDRWGTGIKEMDSTEEEYFNGDEEEEIPVEPISVEEPGPEKLLDLKRGRQDEEGDDELLQLAQKSPRVNDDGPNGTSSSPTSSPSDKTPTPKRPRDADEQEDEMERLGRGAKRVISPTDVRRKSSRGSLNGGRKIAITIGKK